MIAAWRGYSSTVAELVRAGAQIDAQDQVYSCMCMCVCARAAEAVWLVWHLPYHFFHG